MSIEWLLTKAQRGDVHKGTSQRTPGNVASSGRASDSQPTESAEVTDSRHGLHQPAEAPPAENEVDGLSPIHFRCRCGYEGRLSRGETEAQLSAKGNSDVVCFECANCGRHLQYDCLTGTVRVKKGLLGVFFDRFS